jgi:hypothetical protein
VVGLCQPSLMHASVCSSRSPLPQQYLNNAHYSTAFYCQHFVQRSLTLRQ